MTRSCVRSRSQEFVVRAAPEGIHPHLAQWLRRAWLLAIFCGCESNNVRQEENAFVVRIYLNGRGSAEAMYERRSPAQLLPSASEIVTRLQIE